MLVELRLEQMLGLDGKLYLSTVGDCWRAHHYLLGLCALAPLPVPHEGSLYVHLLLEKRKPGHSRVEGEGRWGVADDDYTSGVLRT